MDLLKNFAITLVTTIIFMTAVELIGPDNSMKKYLKFILGLLLVSVILNPIITILTKGESKITEEISNYQKTILTNNNDKEKTSIDTNIREESFKENFNKNCVNLLKKEFKDTNFTCLLDSDVDFDSMTFKVNKLKVIVYDKSIKNVKKVEIGNEGKVEEKEDTRQKEIIDFLASELEIKKEKIEVVYEK